VTLFGEKGACGGCWCMYWRQKSTDFKKNKDEPNKKLFRQLVDEKKELGLIFYVNNEPAAWCSVSPREEIYRVENSRSFKPVDDKPAWSIVCIFINKNYRKQGLSVHIIKSVIEYCKTKNVKILEAYPAIPYASNIPDSFAWTGFESAFKKAGFINIPVQTKSKAYMRFYIS
jgi:GNAT superfamily N-acetyltransferase